MPDKIDYEAALLDPAAVFSGPEDVLDEAKLTKEQKIEILRRWEYDAAEVAVAEEEGMLGDRPLILRRVLLALEELTGGEEAEHPPPTKHDGI